jgi:polyisoprenyl-phosphate glycosyltransferase
VSGLSVVIPALNEQTAIEETVQVIDQALSEAGIEHEIIVVNDGSTDQTGELAAACGATVIDHPTPGGYGRSLKDGIARARYELIAITDADGTYPNERLVDLYRMVAEEGFDMLIGARTGPNYRGSFFKMPARRVFLWLSEYASGRKIDDINSGLRVFRRELCDRYKHTISNGFSFTTTITLAAMLNGYFVKYVPIVYHTRKGSSHVRYLRDTLRALQIIVESILYYNPLKMYLLLVNALCLLALVSGSLGIWVDSQRLGFLLLSMAAMALPAAGVVAALGLSAKLARATAAAPPTGNSNDNPKA